MGLNKDFKTTRGNILMMHPFPSMNQAYRLVLQDERQRECQNTTKFNPESAAFVSSYNHPRNSYPPSNYNKPGFFKGSSSSVSGNGALNQNQPMYGISPNGTISKYFCTHCKIFGHSVERCFKIHGVPNGFPNNPRPQFKGKSTNHVQVDYTGNSDSNDMNNTYDYFQGHANSSEYNMTANGDTTPALSQEQYSHLDSLLSQFKVDNAEGHTGGSSGNSGVSHAFLVGNQAGSGPW